jgi:hypothetical protein
MHGLNFLIMWCWYLLLRNQQLSTSYASKQLLSVKGGGSGSSKILVVF